MSSIFLVELTSEVTALVQVLVTMHVVLVIISLLGKTFFFTSFGDFRLLLVFGEGCSNERTELSSKKSYLRI